MSNWLAEYSSALDARDAREQAQKTVIDAYTKLADRTATLSHAPSGPTPLTETLSPTALSKPAGRPGTPKGKSSPAPQETPTSPDTLSRLRADLTTTQRARQTLEAKVSTQSAELTSLKASTNAQSKQIASLERTKGDLERRMKDRAEELKGKGRLVEDVQDEMVALNLQLNIAEQKAEKLKRENDELTRRWVEKMEAEAAEQNRIHKWGENPS